jgi:NAD(P)-dependent dehydrogenase (short-subunit alcohol dehydrogenase family)
MVSGVLAGRTALVTGGTGGIGAACAGALAKDGAAVVIMSRREEALMKTRAALEAAHPGSRIEIAVGDAGSETDIQAAVKQAHAIGDRLDFLIPTVGGGSFGMLLHKEVADFRAELDYNITSVFIAMRYAVPVMQPGGTVVCISSTAATTPFPSLAAYCASKAGLEGLIRTAADEFSKLGIRVNAVRPGLTRSNATADMFSDPATINSFLKLIPLGRGGEPEDIAAAVRYLAGPESSWVTGQSFAVDGGQELRGNPQLV